MNFFSGILSNWLKRKSELKNTTVPLKNIHKAKDSVNVVVQSHGSGSTNTNENVKVPLVFSYP